MTTGDAWFTAFPIRPAAEAVDALCESWRVLARVQRPGFHPGKREPELTRVLKAHVERVTARERGLLGMWATEAVQNEINLDTAELIEERRTDIVYGWNNEETGIQLVFEFKKLDRLARSRTNYLGEDGLRRFVTGKYSRGQAIAAMVGMLTDPEEQVVPPLRNELAATATLAALRLRLRPSGEAFDRPSLLFPAADFDTEHDRDADLAPGHGTIRVAHLFLEFGYRVARQARRGARSAAAPS
ncbi:MAG: hypothetical protein WDN04_26070 [Rhodospirillales bacterium]